MDWHGVARFHRSSAYEPMVDHKILICQINS
jgi:hypothetical protein